MSSNVLLRKFAQLPRVQSGTGVFVGMVAGLARVNIQGSTIDIRCDGFYPPLPGMPVRVDTVNGVMRVVGPSQALSPRGTVTAVGGGSTTVTVEVDGTEYTLPVMAGYSPSVSDVVVVNWSSGHVLGEEASAPEPETPDSGGSGGSERFTGLTVYPTGSGKYDSSFSNWWGGSEVWASNNNDGAWFYSRRFTALSGVDSFSRVDVYLPRIQESGSCSIGLHPHQSRPGGAPSIGSLVALSDRDGWVRLPTSWGVVLRDNPSYGIGVTAPSGGLNKWRGHSQDSQSGVLRFAGTR